VHPLDNPIWESLTTRRSEFAEGDGLARRFEPEVTLLAGLRQPSEQAYASLATLAADGKPAAVLLPAPQDPPPGWQVVAAMSTLQMTLDASQTISPAAAFDELQPSDAAEMFALAKLTQPGPFGIRTHELGNYIGIRRDGAIAAMAGERLRVMGYSEISAVCTLPQYGGRGFATSLMGVVAGRIRSRGETPFLHVRADNRRAIRLYKHLGFRTRAQFHSLVLRRAPLDPQ
jgi:predicted GNAT family acetyltransferase